MVVPCSNGYDYGLKQGDLNPSLAKYLNRHSRIKVIPFPYKKMNGSGYFGIFDKKQCSNILKNVDVEFLIMTRMKGLELTAINSDTGNWGYETKVLNVATMDQLMGVTAQNLQSFQKIDSDIKDKVDVLIELIRESSISK
jgi:hypothetical protein